MPSHAILLSGLEIIHEEEIQYIRLALYAVVTLFIGVALWLGYWEYNAASSMLE